MQQRRRQILLLSLSSRSCISHSRIVCCKGSKPLCCLVSLCRRGGARVAGGVVHSWWWLQHWERLTTNSRTTSSIAGLVMTCSAQQRKSVAQECSFINWWMSMRALHIDDVSAFFCVSMVGIVFLRAQLAVVASPAEIPAVHDHGACAGVPSVPCALMCVLQLPLHTRVVHTP